MSTDIDWHREIDAALGDDPALAAPLTQTVQLGRRALRRRRTATGAGAFAMVAVLGGVAWASLPGGSPESRSGDVVTAPESATATPGVTTSRDADEEVDFLGEPAAYDSLGRVVMAPGWTEVRRIANPMAYTQPGYRSVGLVATKGEKRTFLLLARHGRDGSSSFSNTATGTLEEWLVGTVASQHTLDLANGDAPPASNDEEPRWVEFGPDGTLRPVDGVTILEQRANPELPESFAPAGTPTAVAKVRDTEGRVWFVLARRLDGSDDFVGSTAAAGRATTDEFLVWARGEYGSGAGLR